MGVLGVGGHRSPSRGTEPVDAGPQGVCVRLGTGPEARGARSSCAPRFEAKTEQQFSFLQCVWDLFQAGAVSHTDMEMTVWKQDILPVP